MSGQDLNICFTQDPLDHECDMVDVWRLTAILSCRGNTGRLSGEECCLQTEVERSPHSV